MNTTPRTATAVLAASLFAACAPATPPGSDDASNYTTPDFQAGADLETAGDPFGAWDIFKDFQGTGFVDPEIGDSTLMDGFGFGADINSGAAQSFKVYATDSNYIDVKRTFNSPLAVGQTFSIDFASYVISQGFKGLDITTNAGFFNSLWNMNGSTSWNIDTKGLGTGDGTAFEFEEPDSYFHCEFTQTSETGGTWTVQRIDPFGSVTDSATGTYGGVIDGFKVYCGGQPGGGETDVFFNNLEVVGEDTPSACDADFNGDGVLDNGDIGAFVNAFLAGCN